MTSRSALRRLAVAASLCAGAATAGAADFQVLHAFDDKRPTAPQVPAGTLTLANDGSITVDTGFASPVGLWALAFGNGVTGQANTLYFTAGVNNQSPASTLGFAIGEVTARS